MEGKARNERVRKAKRALTSAQRCEGQGEVREALRLLLVAHDIFEDLGIAHPQVLEQVARLDPAWSSETHQPSRPRTVPRNPPKAPSTAAQGEESAAPRAISPAQEEGRAAAQEGQGPSSARGAVRPGTFLYSLPSSTST